MKPKSFFSSGLKRPVASFLLLCLVFASHSASALTTISQGFLTSDKVILGSIVSLESGSSDKVLAASVNNSNGIIGVVINEGNSLLSLSTNKENQVQVATSGIVQALVSDINGEVSTGDQVTASPISGVGMKATDSVKVVGIAQGDLKDSSSGTKQAYKDTDGQEKSVFIAQIPVLINASYFFKQPERTIIPSAVQKLANALAGKAVKPLPIIISLAIFVVAMIAVVAIIYSTIKNSIISVGRNPMSQAAIYRNLIQISVLVLAILAVAVIAIYMVLTKI